VQTAPTRADGAVDPEELPVTDPMTFDPISRQTVSAQIREQLLRRMTTGELAPGARVPSERELSEQFEVARTSVREAIQGLLSLGYIERRGNRSWVAERLPEVTVRGADDEKGFVRQLFETRRLLELPIFSLAAERSDDDDHAAGLRCRRFDEPLTLEEFRRSTASSTPHRLGLRQPAADRALRQGPRPAVPVVVVRDVAERRAQHHERRAADRRRTRSTAAGRSSTPCRPATRSRWSARWPSHLDTIEHSMIDELG
jgi:DNA-binding transcriptional regulator YhcF (GntR family)